MRQLHFLLLLLPLLLFISCKEKNAPEDDVAQQEDYATIIEDNSVIVFETDSDEWSVCLFKEHLFYSDAVKVSLPSPWKIPIREEAQILRTLEYPHDERFITSDGYTFGMPSANVSKAGSKTKYSVLGLYKRKTVINIQF